MNLPKQPQRAVLIRQIQGLKGNAQFAAFVAWLKSELEDRDATNRIPGEENKSSEAGCLADILRIVAACWAPGTDRDAPEPGAE